MKHLLLITIILLAGGCTHVPVGEQAHDPYEDTNRSIYSLNDTIDEYFLVPVAECYAYIVPDRVRMCVTNFFDNLFYPNTILNDFLQGKFKQGLSDSGRMAVNSTLGIFGLFDPATELGMEQNKEDFGQTLAVWGANEGPFLMLPFLGPNTARDAPDLLTSKLVDPLTYVEYSVALPAKIFDIINWRANMLDATKMMDKTSIDRYLSLREFYRQNRINLIYDGNPPEIDIFDDEDFLEEDLEEDLE